MRKKCVRRAIFLLLFVWGCIGGSMASYGAECGEESEEYLTELFDQVDFSELDLFLEEQEEEISFSDVVESLLTEGILGADYSLLGQWILDALFLEISQNRTLLVEIALLAIGFSLLKNFAGAFQSAYVSDLCFVLVYCVLAVLLLKSFVNFEGIVEDTLNRSVEFMETLVPTFCLTMVFSSGVAGVTGFYQLAFFVIYLVQWLFVQILLPMIQVYVLFELLNHFFEEEKFRNLSELLHGVICWGMKVTAMAVLGLNVVQNLIAPAKDRLASGAATRAASLIPGVGNAVSAVSELLVGSGIVLKNCVGVAAVLILLALGLVPMAKLACLTFFYKLAAAVTEPVTDRRIAGCLKGMAEGGLLYLRLTGYSLVLMLATIALTASASAL